MTCLVEIFNIAMEHGRLNSQKENLLWVCVAMLVPVSEIISTSLEDIAIMMTVTITVLMN